MWKCKKNLAPSITYTLQDTQYLVDSFSTWCVYTSARSQIQVRI